MKKVLLSLLLCSSIFGSVVDSDTYEYKLLKDEAYCHKDFIKYGKIKSRVYCINNETIFSNDNGISFLTSRCACINDEVWVTNEIEILQK